MLHAKSLIAAQDPFTSGRKDPRPQAYDTLAVLRALLFIGGGGGGGAFLARDGGGGGACRLPFGADPFNVE